MATLVVLVPTAVMAPVSPPAMSVVLPSEPAAVPVPVPAAVMVSVAMVMTPEAFPAMVVLPSEPVAALVPLVLVVSVVRVSVQPWVVPLPELMAPVAVMESLPLMLVVPLVESMAAPALGVVLVVPPMLLVVPMVLPAVVVPVSCPRLSVVPQPVPVPVVGAARAWVVRVLLGLGCGRLLMRILRFCVLSLGGLGGRFPGIRCISCCPRTGGTSLRLLSVPRALVSRC
jgi:hypothetical protein